jgi:ribosome-binding ATPase YchF (GTP1/OBG family)
MYVANVDDSDIGKSEPNPYVKKLLEYAQKEGSPVVQICGKIESEIAELSDEERSPFFTTWVWKSRDSIG